MTGSSQWLVPGLSPSLVTPVKALEAVVKDIVRCPLLQAPPPALSDLSKEAQEQQRNKEGVPVRSKSGSDQHEYKGN